MKKGILERTGQHKTLDLDQLKSQRQRVVNLAKKLPKFQFDKPEDEINEPGIVKINRKN